MTDQTGRSRRTEAPGRAVVFMIGSGLLVTINDASMKWVGAELPLGQVLAIRGLTALLLITIFLCGRRQWHLFRVRYPAAQALRAALMIASTFLFISGLRLMPLTEAIAIAFVGPIFVTALAPVALKEKVGWRRWTAVLVGFAGVLVLLRPSEAGLQWAALLPAGAALCGAFRDLITRGISDGEASATTLFYSTLGVTLASGAVAPFVWQTPSGTEYALLAMAGLVLCVAHFLGIEAFRFAEAALVTPFRYCTLIWAMVIGFSIWGDVPDGWTLLGAALLIGSGLYIFHREGRQSAK